MLRKKTKKQSSCLCHLILAGKFCKYCCLLFFDFLLRLLLRFYIFYKNVFEFSIFYLLVLLFEKMSKIMMQPDGCVLWIMRSRKAFYFKNCLVILKFWNKWKNFFDIHKFFLLLRLFYSRLGFQDFFHFGCTNCLLLCWKLFVTWHFSTQIFFWRKLLSFFLAKNKFHHNNFYYDF